MAGGAAFFDLDRTLIRRSSALALAGSFRRRGLIGRRALARAGVSQLLFTTRGANHDTVQRATENGLAVLRGLTPTTMRELVSDAMEPTLRPLVYREALELAAAHRERGEPIAEELGLDGAVGTLCEVVDERYTGRPLRSCYGRTKAAAVRQLAARMGIDLSASTAYSDGHTDLPFLEAVGRPVAVNPDRELRRVATERGWPVLRFREALVPRRRVAGALRRRVG